MNDSASKDAAGEAVNKTLRFEVRGKEYSFADLERLRDSVEASVTNLTQSIADYDCNCQENVTQNFREKIIEMLEMLHTIQLESFSTERVDEARELKGQVTTFLAEMQRYLAIPDMPLSADEEEIRALGEELFQRQNSGGDPGTSIVLMSVGLLGIVISLLGTAIHLQSNLDLTVFPPHLQEPEFIVTALTLLTFSISTIAQSALSRGVNKLSLQPQFEHLLDYIASNAVGVHDKGSLRRSIGSFIGDQRLVSDPDALVTNRDKVVEALTKECWKRGFDVDDFLRTVGNYFRGDNPNPLRNYQPISIPGNYALQVVEGKYDADQRAYLDSHPVVRFVAAPATAISAVIQVLKNMQAGAWEGV